MKNRRLRLTVWTAGHFAVDFSCFVVLFGALKPACLGTYGAADSAAAGAAADTVAGSGLETVTIGFLIYNIIAFGLQPFIGSLCDSRESWRCSAGRNGILLTATGLLLGMGSTASSDLAWLAWLGMAVCALGNAAFHVGAGRDVLVHSEGRMTDNGIFVSSGALGVGLGTLLGSGFSSGEISLWLFFWAGILLSFLSASCGKYHLSSPADEDYSAAAGFCQAKDRPFLTAVSLLFLVILLRAFAGSSIPLEWERAGLLVLLPSAASCLGKALGGIIGDRLGAMRTGVGSLLLSIPLIVFGSANPVLSLIGILLFNMTMPITLCALVALMPKNPGFAFGLTTLALLAGTAVTFFWMMPEEIVKPMLAVLIIISAVCIGLTVTDKKGEE